MSANNLRSQYGSYYIVNASVNILFKFLVNHMAFVNYKGNDPQFKDLAGYFNNLFKDKKILTIRNELKNICVEALNTNAKATIHAANIYFKNTNTNSEPYPSSRWFYDMCEVSEEVIENYPTILNNGNAIDFLAQIDYKIQSLIKKINTYQLHQDDTLFLERLNACSVSIGKLIDEISTFDYKFPVSNSFKKTEDTKNPDMFRKIGKQVNPDDLENHRPINNIKKKPEKRSFSQILELRPPKPENDDFIKVEMMEKCGSTYNLKTVVMRKQAYNEMKGN